MFNKEKFSPRDIKKIEIPPSSITGRAGKIRIANKRADLTLIAAYFIPPSTILKGRTQAAKGNTIIADTIEKWLLDAPLRSTPVVGTDLNDGLGIMQEQVGLDNIEDKIGPHLPSQEGLSGSLFRKILCNCDLSAVNTFWKECKETYIGPRGSSSRIDFIAIPTDMMQHVTNCKTLINLARKIAPFNSIRVIDHVPLYLEFRAPSGCGIVHGNIIRFDRDAIMDALLNGKKRWEFCKEVYEKVNMIDGWKQKIESGAPDRAWKDITDCVIEVSSKMFAPKSWKSDLHLALQQERDELLKTRKNLRLKIAESEMRIENSLPPLSNVGDQNRVQESLESEQKARSRFEIDYRLYPDICDFGFRAAEYPDSSSIAKASAPCPSNGRGAPVVNKQTVGPYVYPDSLSTAKASAPCPSNGQGAPAKAKPDVPGPGNGPGASGVDKQTVGQAGAASNDEAVAYLATSSGVVEIEYSAIPKQNVHEDAIIDCELKLSRLTFRLRKLFRARCREVREQRLQELFTAKANNQYAVVWRLLHQIAGKGTGPKKRNYTKMSVGQASIQEWKRFFESPAVEGGMGGTIVDFDVVLEDEIKLRENENNNTHDMNHVVEARDDYFRICKYLRKAPKRRATPEWSVPTEIWLQLLDPEVRPIKLKGVGAEAIPPGFDRFRVAILQLLTQIRRTKVTPIMWVVSRGWQIPKNNGKSGVKADRTMHGFCPISKAFYGGVLAKGREKDHPYVSPAFNHGYVESRCREDAIAVQEIGSWRLNQLNISHTIDSHDGTNAFQCSSPEILRQAAHCLYRREDLELIQLRFDIACTRVRVQGEEVAIMPSSGNLQGHPNASKEFEVAYNFGIQRFQNKLKQLNFPFHDAMYTSSPFLPSGETVDLSISIYADDVTKKILSDTPKPHLLENRSKVAAKWLKNELSLDGYSMNDDKRESLIVSVGVGSLGLKREIFQNKQWSEGRPMNVMRVLGGQIDSKLGLGPELRHRFQAARISWYMMKNIWYSNTPWSVRKLCFQSIIDGNLYSGLVLRLVSDSNLKKIDKFRLALLRRMMRGKACIKDEGGDGGEIKYRSISSKEVWSHWKLVPSQYDLLIRRIRRYQAWARRPQHHTQILSAFFGKMKIEPHPTTLGDQLCEGANPWAHRFLEDLKCFAEHDDAAASLLDIVGDSVLMIFTDEQCREDFLILDPTIIRAKLTSACIPPPGWINYEDQSLIDCEIDEADKPWTCDSCVDQLISFRTKKQLLAHARTMHSYRDLAAQITITNQCCFCMSTFSSRAGAIQHVKQMFKSHNCPVDFSAIGYEPIWSERMGTCMICDFECEDLAQFQRHVREHSPLTPSQLTLHGIRGGNIAPCVGNAGNAGREHEEGQGRRGGGGGGELKEGQNERARGRLDQGYEQQGIDHHDLDYGKTIITEQPRDKGDCRLCMVHFHPLGKYGLCKSYNRSRGEICRNSEGTSWRTHYGAATRPQVASSSYEPSQGSRDRIEERTQGQDRTILSDVHQGQVSAASRSLSVVLQGEAYIQGQGKKATGSENPFRHPKGRSRD